VLDYLKRTWWRYLGLAFLFTAIWFSYEGHLVDVQWDEQVEEMESKWQAFETEIVEKIEANTKAPNLFGIGKFTTEIIALQTKQYKLQRESLKKTQELYHERYRAYDRCLIFIGLGFFTFCMGLWRGRSIRQRLYFLAALIGIITVHRAV
jgi:hypothetical protein